MSEQGVNSGETTALKRTPLYRLHRELGARMVPFAGYEMPVTYPAGLIKEHIHTREAAGLFDVSHMGQAYLIGPDHATTAAALEALVPGEIAGLGPGRQRYTQLTNDAGGIIDDLMVTRPASPDEDGRLLLVVNAARKALDYAHIGARLPQNVVLVAVDDMALIALQGPLAASVMAGLCPPAAALGFMTAARAELAGIPCHVSRSGYTGEDGFEISLPAERAEDAARALLAHPNVQPVGLGARDTLRLEAGLCLYGHDIDETTSPAEADLLWSVGKRRRAAGGFPGAERLKREIAEGPARRRVGLKLEGRAPAREGCEIRKTDGTPVGIVTSGSFAPSIGVPVAMGYVESTVANLGTPLAIVIRGTPQPATVAPLPFVPNRYHRKSRQDHG
jgi:aminomethyltransferase